jgi:multidrug resistance protein
MNKSWVLIIISISVFIEGALYGIIVPIMPTYVNKFNITSSELGIIFASYAIVILVLAIPIGALSDKIGRKIFIVSGTFLISIASIFFTLANSALLLVFSRIFQGTGAAFIWGVSLAVIADIYSPDKRGRKMAIVTSAMGIGIIVGPVMGGWLTELLGLAFPFYVTSLISGFICILAVLKMSETRCKDAAAKAVEALKIVFSSRNIILICLMVAIFNAFWGFVEAFYPPYLSSSYGYGAGLLGSLFGVSLIVFTSVNYLSGFISDRIGRKPIFLSGLLLLAVEASIITLADSLNLIALNLSLIFVAMGLMVGASIPLVADTVSSLKMESDPYGAASGATNFSWSTGLAVGPLAGGFFIDFYGLFSVFYIHSFTLAVALFICYFFIKEPIRKTVAKRLT